VPIAAPIPTMIGAQKCKIWVTWLWLRGYASFRGDCHPYFRIDL